MTRRLIAVGVGILVVALMGNRLFAEEPATRPAVKPVSNQVFKGLGWLARHQLQSGAWGQGDESQEMGGGLASIKDSPNVADTCMAVMALMRGGSTPGAGEYQQNILKAVDFVCSQVEKADGDDLSITDLKGTRTQTKLGTYIDTFMAAQLLAEVKGQMPDESGNTRVGGALGKIVKKIEKNQRNNGQWANQGWAPTLAQAACAKALNVAVANGVKVDEQVRQRAESYAQADFSRANSGAIGEGRGGGDAGVVLYGAGSQIAAMSASQVNNAPMRDKYVAVLAAPTTMPGERERAKAEIDRIDTNGRMLAQAQQQVVDKLGDQQFMAGFGSNGGEEFLSYLNIGESLFLKGGEDWRKWDDSITGNVNKVQNDDGSWSGHHCITGRTFCTAAALQVLLIDRTPVKK